VTGARASGSRRPPAESATARLDRLLTMVPWLLRRPGVDIAEAAAEFGVSTEQIEADLALIFLCGTPGGMPDDLIDAEWESGKVFLGNADTIARPLRLGVDEAITLIVGLRTLAAVPGLSDREVVEQAMAKIEQAIGTAALPGVDAASSRIHVDIAAGEASGLLGEVRMALTDRRRLHLHYVVPSRDETTERDVDPMRVTTVGGHWYLEGWCHRSGDVRLFRLDRIQELTVLDVDGTPPAQARSRDLDAGVFQPREGDPVVELTLAQGSRWVADYYPHEWRREHPDGRLDVGIRTAHVEWLGRLAWQSGGGVSIREPQRLSSWVAEGARQAVDWYDAR
jgi:proteasome accessory factor C